MRHPVTPTPDGTGRDTPPIEPGWVLVLIGSAVVALACTVLGL